MVVRYVREKAKERINQHRLTPEGKRIHDRRKETVGRSFADAKELHGHRYARFRGLSKVMRQCLLAAACQNMKKIARLLAAFLRLHHMPVKLLEALLKRLEPFADANAKSPNRVLV